MTISKEATLYCNNGCYNSGHTILESLTSYKFEKKIKNIILKYSNRDYTDGYCDFIHITNLGDFHYCLKCVRRIKNQ